MCVCVCVYKAFRDQRLHTICLIRTFLKICVCYYIMVLHYQW